MGDREAGAVRRDAAEIKVDALKRTGKEWRPTVI